jgi:hypothetical protein
VQVRTKREESESHSKVVPTRYYSTKLDFVKGKDEVRDAQPGLAVPRRKRKNLTQRGDSRDKTHRSEERFLTAQADRFAGAKRKEKASACSVRNDGGWAGRLAGRWGDTSDDRG